MSCRELVEQVTAYLEGALGADEARRFEAHVAECGGCEAYVAQIATTIRITGALREDAPDPRVFEALVAGFRAARKAHL